MKMDLWVGEDMEGFLQSSDVALMSDPTKKQD